MLRLTREVRFAINSRPDPQLAHRPTNGHGGFPSLVRFGQYFTLRVALSGALNSDSSYLVNIKEIDSAVRTRVIPWLADTFAAGGAVAPAQVMVPIFDRLRDVWPGIALESLQLSLSPFQSYRAFARELPMVRLSQKFEFSATHRLHNPALNDAQNQRTFGKCNNPHGHGHNYELEVTLRGEPNASGVLIDIPAFETLVAEAVIDRFDHKNLNVELPEFRELNPTVENIARVIFRLLKPPLENAGAKLATVTVWETPKTWCEVGDE